MTKSVKYYTKREYNFEKEDLGISKKENIREVQFFEHMGTGKITVRIITEEREI